jgi:hypothetical protein
MLFIMFRKENHMRARICMLWIAGILPSALASAQHLEVGGFASYGNFDVPRFPDTAVGVGGRLDINITPWLALEGEGSYDFKHPGFEIVSNGATVDVTTLRLGIVHGNGGLKFQLKGGSYFFFLKGGVLDFLPDVRTTSVVGTILNNQPRTGTSTINASFYPGAGIGFHAGPLGIRVDAGDEIYWTDTAHHNLRITFGPTVRF